ncbi:hypothetical protein HYFRA_00009178 [Hymenoscyphus fraxineus]|uniref:Uncharacterized protein n=1 Tax=Hymenoscyphus fraxineus TaxID=746836 RepID=A0A9N9KVX3_9HELO|nr:hypothetical protein HYFRA_00009178 [Hymenoscyphus fraxineus]
MKHKTLKSILDYGTRYYSATSDLKLICAAIKAAPPKSAAAPIAPTPFVCAAPVLLTLVDVLVVVKVELPLVEVRVVTMSEVLPEEVTEARELERLEETELREEDAEDPADPVRVETEEATEERDEKTEDETEERDSETPGVEDVDVLVVVWAWVC